MAHEAFYKTGPDIEGGNKRQKALTCRIEQLERSRRRLIGLTSILTISVLFLSVWTLSVHGQIRPETPESNRPIESRIILETVPPSTDQNLVEAEKLQAALNRTHAELARTKVMLEKANAAAEKRDKPPLAGSRKKVASQLADFRFALSKTKKKLSKLNERSSEKRADGRETGALAAEEP